jgi:iron complex outermembrane receptor protein
VLLTGGLRDSSDNKNALTQDVGLVVKPVPGLSLFASRIEGLQKGPTVPLAPSPINFGAVFAPFQSTQYEVGGKLAIGDMDASLTAFQIKQPTAYAVPIDLANPGAGSI